MNEQDKEEIDREWKASQVAGILSSFAAIWLMLSPFVFEFSLIRPALWNSLCVGTTALVLSFIRLGNLARYFWPSYLCLPLAVWLACAPYALGYAVKEAPFWNSLAVGIVLGVMALWSIRDSPPRNSGRP